MQSSSGSGAPLAVRVKQNFQKHFPRGIFFFRRASAVLDMQCEAGKTFKNTFRKVFLSMSSAGHAV